MDLLLALMSWAAVVGTLVLTPFLSLFLVIGWASLIARNTSIFNRISNPYRLPVLALCLYIPFIAASFWMTGQTVEQLRLEAPLGSLCFLNLGPLWWIIGAAGLLAVGLQSNRPKNRRLYAMMF